MIGDEDTRGADLADAIAYGLELNARGYIMPRRLPSGRWVAVLPGLYATFIACDLHSCGHERLYSYDSILDACLAIWSRTWDGIGDPPGPWIRASDSGGQRYNALRYLKGNSYPCRNATRKP